MKLDKVSFIMDVRLKRSKIISDLITWFYLCLCEEGTFHLDATSLDDVLRWNETHLRIMSRALLPF